MDTASIVCGLFKDFSNAYHSLFKLILGKGFMHLHKLGDRGAPSYDKIAIFVTVGSLKVSLWAPFSTDASSFLYVTRAVSGWWTFRKVAKKWSVHLDATVGFYSSNFSIDVLVLTGRAGLLPAPTFSFID